eukprot:1793581-Prymnesium_polylepis.2
MPRCKRDVPMHIRREDNQLYNNYISQLPDPAEQREAHTHLRPAPVYDLSTLQWGAREPCSMASLLVVTRRLRSFVTSS